MKQIFCRRPDHAQYSSGSSSNQERRSIQYSLALHGLLALILLILSYHNTQIFNFGNAVKSQQQVQIVNATMVLPPNLSKVIANVPPAPAPPTPPVKTPQQTPNPKPIPTPTPTPQKPTPQKLAQDKAATLVQKTTPPKQNSQQSNLQQKQALQKLKALGLSSLQQAVNSKQLEAASAAQASENLTLKEKYMGLIQQTIRSNWINQFPQSNLTVTLQIALDAHGNVLNVLVKQTSGNAAFDRQAVLAVKKSSPLPLPPDPSMAKDFMSLVLPFSNQH